MARPLHASYTFHESYGELTRSLLSAIRKYNVSPSDYDYLVECYGRDYATIQREIIAHSPNGNYSDYLFRRA